MALFLRTAPPFGQQNRTNGVRGMNTKKASPPPPGEIVNVLVAARRAGDHEMERTGREILARDYGIRVTFSRDRAHGTREGSQR